MLNKDLLNWKELVDRVTSENTSLKQVIDDLEDKNRKLVEKINEQIMLKAVEYKERTLQALTKSDSPYKLRQALAPSNHRLYQVLQDENKPPVEV